MRNDPGDLHCSIFLWNIIKTKGTLVDLIKGQMAQFCLLQKPVNDSLESVWGFNYFFSSIVTVLFDHIVGVEKRRMCQWMSKDTRQGFFDFLENSESFFDFYGIGKTKVR